MRRYGHIFITCSLSITCLLSLGVAGCDDNITNLENDPSTAEKPAGQALSKKGGEPGPPDGGGGGNSAGYEQTLSDGLVGAGDVNLAKNNKKTVETTSSDFILDLNFDATAATAITHVQSDPAGRSRDEILADGECALGCAGDDPDCATLPGGLPGVQDRLLGVLTRTGDTRPLDLLITVGMDHLGENHGYHFIRVKDYNGPGDEAPGYPKIALGKCGAPDCQPVAEFVGPGPDPLDDSVARIFKFSQGTLAVDEKQGVNSFATLTCNNLDEVWVTVTPVSN